MRNAAYQALAFWRFAVAELGMSKAEGNTFDSAAANDTDFAYHTSHVPFTCGNCNGDSGTCQYDMLDLETLDCYL